MSDLAQARQAEAQTQIAQRLEQIEMLLADSGENGEAIAENLHTANLLSYLAITERRGAKDDAYVALDHLVRERLGLSDA